MSDQHAETPPLLTPADLDRLTAALVDLVPCRTCRVLEAMGEDGEPLPPCGVCDTQREAVGQLRAQAAALRTAEQPDRCSRCDQPILDAPACGDCHTEAQARADLERDTARRQVGVALQAEREAAALRAQLAYVQKGATVAELKVVALDAEVAALRQTVARQVIIIGDRQRSWQDTSCALNKLRDSIDEALPIDWADSHPQDVSTDDAKDATRIDLLFDHMQDLAALRRRGQALEPPREKIRGLTDWSLHIQATDSSALVGTPLAISEQPPFPPCYGCGGHIFYDTGIDNETWNRVIRARGLPEWLCAACILRFFAEQGESFTAELWSTEIDVFGGLRVDVRVAALLPPTGETQAQEKP